jgi:type II secretion system protein G
MNKHVEKLNNTLCKLCLYTILISFSVLLCTLPVHANQTDELFEFVISAIDQKCQTMQVDTRHDVLDDVLSVDREFVAASMAMQIYENCECLPSELKRIRSDYSESLKPEELDSLIGESTKKCSIRSARDHFGSLCRASMLSETDDHNKIDNACECMTKAWNKLSDKEIYQYSMATYNNFRKRVDGNSTVGDEVADSPMELESKRCVENAGIVANSQYKKEREAMRKNILARRHADNILRMLAAAINLYRLDHNHYPSNAQGLSILLEESISSFSRRKAGPYLDSLPTDLWGNNISYFLSKGGRRFKVLSFGQDGKPGGKGFDQDIVLSSTDL